MLSLIIPLYRSEENLARLFRELRAFAAKVPISFEVVFVIDGSPDRCDSILAQTSPTLPFLIQVVHLSRNFGAFAAIMAGLRHGRGDYFSVIAADLQEPLELVLEFLTVMRSGTSDIVVGRRLDRNDPLISSFQAKLFWSVYRKLINPEIPSGGVDVFGCTRVVRDTIVTFKEADSSLIALLFWIGFSRTSVSYERRERIEGRSAWTWRKKWRYAMNSIFNFTDLPIHFLLWIGFVGVAFSLFAGGTVFVMWLIGNVAVAGYTPIILSIFFFGALTILSLGIVGQYLWLSLQNARGRPTFIVRSVDTYAPMVGQAESITKQI